VQKKKLLVMSTLLVAIVLLSIGTIAYFRRTVNGDITGQTGNLVLIVNEANAVENESFSVSLNRSEEEPYVMPDDKGTFDININSTGSSTDVEVTITISRTNLPDNLKFYLDENYTQELTTKTYMLKKSDDMTMTVPVYWFWDGSVDDVNDSLFINEALTARIEVSAMSFEYGMMQNVLTELSPKSTESTEEVDYNGNDAAVEPMSNVEPMISAPEFTPENLVRYVEFTNNFSVMPDECTEENLCYDISYEEEQKYPVYAYFETTSDGYYNLYIICEKLVAAPVDSASLFADFVYLDSIKFNNLFNTFFVTNMSSMFSDCSKLTSLDLSIFDTSNVTNMSGMFYGCSKLTSLDLSSFDTSNVTNMSGIFVMCLSLTSLDVSNFDTSSVTNMSSMFSSCSGLTSLDVSNFDTSSVTNMSGMFSGCSKLTSLDVSNFDTSNVTNMSYMFSGCLGLTSLDLRNFDTSKVTDMNNMFRDCFSLVSLNLSSFDTSKVISMVRMFDSTPKVVTEISLINAAVNTNNMFLNGATDLNSKVILNYTTDTETIVDSLVNGTTIIKGSLVS